MLPYQAGIAKFEGNDVKIFSISEDNAPSQKEIGKQVNASFPMLSDVSKRELAKRYGVLIKSLGMANRATFVVDKDGKIAHIEEGEFGDRPDRRRHGVQPSGTSDSTIGEDTQRLGREPSMAASAAPLISWGRISAAFPCRAQSTLDENGVSSRLTSITLAPFCLA